MLFLRLPSDATPPAKAALCSLETRAERREEVNPWQKK
jgi:hypothetical protein